MSATNRMFMALLGVLHRAGLADDDDLDLPRILKLPLDTARDIGGQLDRAGVVHVLRLDHDAHLAARLDGIRLFHTGEAIGDLLERLEALDVVLDALPASAG